MSVIIRLQGLPWSASAMNIRHFFTGLSIPAGGVHIIGGEGGDAFIAFSSDDDARMAMKKNMCPLNGTQVQLFLSSKSEMQSVIDAARSGSSAPAATPAGNTQQNIQQQQQQRPQFSNMASAFPTDNQNQNNLTGNIVPAPINEFNPQMQQNQFVKNDWQGFQMYGGRVDEQNPQFANQFQQFPRMPMNQMDGRFPPIPGANERGHFAPLQQDKGFSDMSSQFHDANNQMQVGTSLGIQGMHQGADMSTPGSMTMKQPLFGDHLGVRPGGIPPPPVSNDNPAALLSNIAAMNRGQVPFPNQVNMGANRNMFNVNVGRSIPGNDMTANIPGNRGSNADGVMGRQNTMDDNSRGESMDSLGQTDKFQNQFTNEQSQTGPDSRKSEMMDWGGDNMPDSRFLANQKMFDQDIKGEKPNVNMEKLPGPDGRPFQQFPFRGEHDRARMNNRLLEAPEKADPIIDPAESHLKKRQDREPLFPGRDIRTGSRFGPALEPEERYPDKFADKPVDRFSNDSVPLEEAPPSTRYPPDDEHPVGPGEGRPQGRFPPARGRNDELRYPPDERQFPPEPRFPNEDRRLPPRDPTFHPEHERFSEGDRKFPPPRGDYLSEERRHAGDERRFPPGHEGRRFPPDEGRFPPEDRIGLHPDRMRPDEFGGRRPGDNPFAPDDIRFREREDELRQRDAFGRGRRGMEDRFLHDHPNEGRLDMRPGFRDFDEGEEMRRFPHDRRFPPERDFRDDDEEEEFRGPGVMEERRRGMSRWERDRFDDWQEDNESFPRPGGPRGPLSDNADFPGRPGNLDMEGPMDMDQRSGRDLMMRGPPDGRRGPMFEGRGRPGMEGGRPDPSGMRGLGVEDRRGPGMEGFRPPFIEGRGHAIEGMRGRGSEGMRGRGIEGMRGRGMDGRGGHGMDGRRGPAVPSMVEENSFDYGHGSVGRGPPADNIHDEEEFEAIDFDSRFPPGPTERGGLFDRPPRGRGDFFNRGRPGPPIGRGRGFDVDRRFEDAGPEGRFSMDVDARNVGGRPDGPPIRPVLGEGKMPDFSVKPGSGKGLLGDAPVTDKPAAPEPEKKEAPGDPARRDLENRSMRKSNDRDRDHRSSDRRGRDREDRRSGERDRSRYRYERDRSDRRRSRSRERGGRDDGRRSRDRSTSTKKDHEASKSDTHTKSEPRKRSIHMKNMPANIHYKDVRRFLQPIDVPFDAMKIIADKQGQRTGDVFVQFRHADDASRAFRRNGERFNGRPIAISLCSDEEFSTADSSSTNKKETTAPTAGESQKAKEDDKLRYIVQIKNLPLNITKQDIVQFFNGLTIENSGEAVYIEYNQTGIATGIGFVEFKSDYDYKKALTQDGSLMGTVPLRVFPGKKEEADDLKKKQQEMLQRAALRNVANSRIMQQRPQGQPPRPQGGQPPRPQGGQPPRPQGGQPPRPQGGLGPQAGQPPRPQGPSTRPALIGPRPGLGPQPQSPAAQSSASNQSTRASTPSDGPETVCVHIQGLPLLATPQDIREFFSDCQIALRGINIAHDSRGKPLGEGFVEFKFKSDFEKAIKKDKTSFGRHIVAVKPIGKKDMMERLENARGLPAQQGSQQNQPPEEQNKSQASPQANDKQQNPGNPPQNSQQGSQPAGQTSQGAKSLMPNPLSAPGQGVTVTSGSKSIPAGVLNKSWYYVRCQNFPPDISIAEILTFFQGFRPIGESIRLHYSSEGKPTGNAVVGFMSPDEAQRALQRLNMKVCRQNVVTLHPA